MTLDDDPPSAFPHRLHKADELQRVAQALLRMQQNGSIVEWRSVPQRLIKGARGETRDGEAVSPFLPEPSCPAICRNRYRVAPTGLHPALFHIDQEVDDPAAGGRKAALCRAQSAA